MNTQQQLIELYAPVAEELREVRAIISKLWRDSLELVKVSCDDMPAASGKLLRPALCLLSAGACGAPNLAEFSRLAASYEAFHLASLAHDDVIDHARMRRGHQSLNALWDNHAAVLGGDYMVARSVEIMAEYGSCPVISQAVVSVRRMAECELSFFGRTMEQATPEDCIALARGKTASLFAAACSAPALLLQSAGEAPLSKFGEALGIAFQIIDDLIDLTQTSEAIGKPSCGDVIEGKPTVPLLYLAERLDKPEREHFNRLFKTLLEESDREWIRSRMLATGAADAALALAREYAVSGQQQLFSLPESSFRESLYNLMELLLLRTA